MTESEFLASLGAEERERFSRFFQVRDVVAEARSCGRSLICKIEPWRGCPCRSAASAAINAWEIANGRDAPNFMGDDEN